jgi:4-phytase/acid phosphatase
VLLVGHDDNIAGLASWLRIGFKVPGYAATDPPIGGGLGFEVWRAATSERYVRAINISQTPDQVRNLTRLSSLAPPFEAALPLPACTDGPEHTCPVGKFLELLSGPG